MDFKPGPELFEITQGVLIVVLVVGLLRFARAQTPASRFKATTKKSAPQKPPRKTPEEVRVLLQGVVLSGLPHQILNVREDASEFEIRKAHRDLIKRFHPDKVGPEGSRQWYEGQRASEIINGARDQMLKKLKAGTEVE